MTVAGFKAYIYDLDAQLGGRAPSAARWADVLFNLEGIVEAPPIVVTGPPRQMTPAECAAAGDNVVPFRRRAA